MIGVNEIVTLAEIPIYSTNNPSIIVCPKCAEGLLTLQNVGNILSWALNHNQGICYGQATEAETGIILEGDFGAPERQEVEAEPDNSQSDGSDN